MSSRQPSGSFARPRGPRLLSIPIHTLAKAHDITLRASPREDHYSAKGACQIVGDAQSKDVGSVELASAHPSGGSCGSYGTVIQIPDLKSGARICALEIVSLLYNGPRTSSYDLGHSAFHISCPVEWLCPTEEETKLDLAKKEERGELWPTMVWQPYFEGEYCQPAQLNTIKEMCKKVTILAPNHIDLLTMCSKISTFENKLSSLTKSSQRIYNGRNVVEECAREFLESGIGMNGLGYMVVKAGDLGCLVASLAFGDRFTWLAALKEGHHTPTDTQEETTMFVGAVSFATFVQKQNIIRAAKLGMVAASFAGEGGIRDAGAFRARMDAYSEVLREERRRLQLPRDLNDPSAYTSDEDN